MSTSAHTHTHLELCQHKWTCSLATKPHILRGLKEQRRDRIKGAQSHRITEYPELEGTHVVSLYLKKIKSGGEERSSVRNSAQLSCASFQETVEQCRPGTQVL